MKVSLIAKKPYMTRYIVVVLQEISLCELFDNKYCAPESQVDGSKQMALLHYPMQKGIKGSRK